MKILTKGKAISTLFPMSKIAFSDLEAGEPFYSNTKTKMILYTCKFTGDLYVGKKSGTFT
jgi:competence transcription factor ComK